MPDGFIKDIVTQTGVFKDDQKTKLIDTLNGQIERYLGDGRGGSAFERFRGAQQSFEELFGAGSEGFRIVGSNRSVEPWIGPNVGNDTPGVGEGRQSHRNTERYRDLVLPPAPSSFALNGSIIVNDDQSIQIPVNWTSPGATKIDGFILRYQVGVTEPTLDEDSPNRRLPPNATGDMLDGISEGRYIKMELRSYKITMKGIVYSLLESNTLTIDRTSETVQYGDGTVAPALTQFANDTAPNGTFSDNASPIQKTKFGMKAVVEIRWNYSQGTEKAHGFIVRWSHGASSGQSVTTASPSRKVDSTVRKFPILIPANHYITFKVWSYYSSKSKSVEHATGYQYSAWVDYQPYTTADIEDIPDGATHGKTKLTALTSGEIDLDKDGVLNKHLGNIDDDATSDRKAVNDNEKTGAGHGYSNLDADGLKNGREVGGALKLSAGGKLQLQSDSSDVINTLGNFQKDVQGSVDGRTASVISGSITARGNLDAGKKVGGDSGLVGDRVGDVVEDDAGAGKIKQAAVVKGKADNMGSVHDKAKDADTDLDPIIKTRGGGDGVLKATPTIDGKPDNMGSVHDKAKNSDTDLSTFGEGSPGSRSRLLGSKVTLESGRDAPITNALKVEGDSYRIRREVALGDKTLTTEQQHDRGMETYEEMFEAGNESFMITGSNRSVSERTGAGLGSDTRQSWINDIKTGAKKILGQILDDKGLKHDAAIGDAVKQNIIWADARVERADGQWAENIEPIIETATIAHPKVTVPWIYDNETESIELTGVIRSDVGKTATVSLDIQEEGSGGNPGSTITYKEFTSGSSGNYERFSIKIALKTLGLVSGDPYYLTLMLKADNSGAINNQVRAPKFIGWGKE